MHTPPTTMATSTYRAYDGTPPENYERYFVPTIGTPFARPLVQAARLRGGERVLDVACGTGAATRLAAEAVAPAGSVAGIDAHPGMLAVARTATRAEASSGGPPIEWHHADAADLPFPDGSFDVALCSMGLQFFPEQAAALREVRRVLGPGGRVVVGTPGPMPPLFQAIADPLARHLGPEASGFLDTVFSVHDPDELRGLLVAAGFDDVHVDRSAIALRLPPPAHFLWQYVRSTPVAPVAEAIGPEARAALEQDVVETWTPFVVEHELRMEPGLLLGTGERAEEERRSR